MPELRRVSKVLREYKNAEQEIREYIVHLEETASQLSEGLEKQRLNDISTGAKHALNVIKAVK